MKRRDFFKSGALAAGASLGVGAVPAIAESDKLPETQSKPNPDLGTHWKLFEKLSAQCVPKMSFLEEQYTDPAAWIEAARAEFRRALLFREDFDLQPEVVEKTDCGDFVRERVIISTTAGYRTPLYLLVPKNLKGPAPGIVALHDHGGFYFWGKEKLTRVEPVHPELQKFKDKYYSGRDIADELARLGYVVAVPDMIHWGERAMYFEADPERVKKRTLDVTAEDIKQFNARSWAHEELLGRSALATGTTVAGIIAHDDYCAAEYLCSRPEVNPERVGCTGLSVGSVRTIFLGALHPKVRASVAVCWMCGYQPLIRNRVRYIVGFCMLAPGLYDKLDWPDLAGLHWPGDLMCINGLKDELYPLENAKEAFLKVEKIFAKMNAQDNFKGVFFDGPHEFNREMQDKAFAWLAEKLA